MSIHIRVGGAWKEVDTPSILVDGVWVDVDEAYVNVGGVWKEVYTAVSLADLTPENTMVYRTGSDVTLVSSDFALSGYTHESSDWEIYNYGVLYDSSYDDTSNLTSYLLTPPATGPHHFTWRVRHTEASLGTSAWSELTTVLCSLEEGDFEKLDGTEIDGDGYLIASGASPGRCLTVPYQTIVE